MDVFFNQNFNEEDMQTRLNLDELYEKKQQRDLTTLGSYNKILNRIHVKIKMVAKNQIADQFCWYIIPEVMIGIPKYDHGMCTAYIMDKLRENGFNIRYTHPNLLLIAWESWCPTYVRNEIKKKTGISIDSSGKKIEEEEKQLTLKESLKTKIDKIDRIDRDVKQNKIYTNIDDYKPSGNIYNENILRKIHEKKS